MRLAGSIALVVLLIGGCGGDEQRAGAPEPTPTPTATATATPDPAPKRARSLRGCLELWNSESVPTDNTQVTAAQFVAELARKKRTPARVSFERPDCYVTVPVGPRRIAWFAAPRGRLPYTNPERRGLEPGEYVPYNARALRSGRIRLR